MPRHYGDETSDRALAAAQKEFNRRVFNPDNCPHCGYDRKFPSFEEGGWLQQDNNGPIVPCPVCNADGAQSPRP